MVELPMMALGIRVATRTRTRRTRRCGNRRLVGRAVVLAVGLEAGTSLGRIGRQVAVAACRVAGVVATAGHLRGALLVAVLLDDTVDEATELGVATGHLAVRDAVAVNLAVLARRRRRRSGRCSEPCKSRADKQRDSDHLGDATRKVEGSRGSRAIAAETFASPPTTSSYDQGSSTPRS